MKPKTFIKKMEAIAKDYKATKLKQKVATMLIDQMDGYETAEQMFNDLSHGCESGVVGGLIYYVDTYAFAKEYIEEILELYQETREEIGDDSLNIPTDTDALNWLAWFGFEQTSYNIANELGIEY